MVVMSLNSPVAYTESFLIHMSFSLFICGQSSKTQYSTMPGNFESPFTLLYIPAPLRPHDTNLNTLSTQPPGPKITWTFLKRVANQTDGRVFFIAHEKGFKSHVQPQTGAYSL